MLRNLVIIGLMFFNVSVFADAYDGNYLGFRLGEKYVVPRGAESWEHVTGALVYAIDPGQHPHHLESMSIFVSPRTFIIGSIFGERYFSSKRAAEVFAKQYMSDLEEKYADWIRRGSSLTREDYQLWVDVERKPPIVKPPIADDWSSNRPFRVGIGLIYAPSSLGRGNWFALIRRDLGEVELAASNR